MANNFLPPSMKGSMNRVGSRKNEPNLDPDIIYENALSIGEALRNSFMPSEWRSNIPPSKLPDPTPLEKFWYGTLQNLTWDPYLGWTGEKRGGLKRDLKNMGIKPK